MNTDAADWRRRFPTLASGDPVSEGGREAVLYRVLPGQSRVLMTCCILARGAYSAERGIRGQAQMAYPAAA